MSTKKYAVSDGTLMLTLEVAEEGGYNVTSPLDPQLNTQGDTLEEAFENAYDAHALLTRVRARMAQIPDGHARDEAHAGLPESQQVSGPGSAPSATTS